MAVSKAREKLYLDELISAAQTWLPTVRQLRPQHSRDNVVRVFNRRDYDWTVERLRRAVHRMVREKLADPALSLRDIAAQLDQMGSGRCVVPRKWQPSSAKVPLDEGNRFALVRS